MEACQGAKTVTVRRLKLKLIKKVKKVTWTEDTVDNEHMGKKKSKICCIFCSKNKNTDVNKYERP